MRLSKAEKATLELSKAMIVTGGIMSILTSMLPLNAGEYMNALVGALGTFIFFSALGSIPFAIACIITTIVARFN